MSQRTVGVYSQRARHEMLKEPDLPGVGVRWAREQAHSPKCRRGLSGGPHITATQPTNHIISQPHDQVTTSINTSLSLSIHTSLPTYICFAFVSLLCFVCLALLALSCLACLSILAYLRYTRYPWAGNHLSLRLVAAHLPVCLRVLLICCSAAAVGELGCRSPTWSSARASDSAPAFGPAACPRSIRRDRAICSADSCCQSASSTNASTYPCQ